MTTITIDKNLKLSKTHFKDEEELQNELFLMRQAEFELSPEHIEILREREAEADQAADPGLSIEDLKASIKRKNV